MSRIRLLALSVCLLVLGACGPDSATPPPAATDSGAAPIVAEGEPESEAVGEGEVASAARPARELPAEDLGEFRIVSVLLGKSMGSDKLVLADSEVFASKDSIHASVLTTGAHQGLSISARWLAPDGSVIAETTQALVPTAATATTFDISNPDGWPVGEYQVQIGVNKRTLQTRKFKVR
jgi:hypothetical protein